MNSAAARLRVDEVGSCLLASVGGAVGAAMAVARTVPAEATRVSLVMADPNAAHMPELARRLGEWVPDRWGSVRLVAARAAVAAEMSRAPAQELCDLLGVDVVAPDGDVLAVPGGSLFVVGEQSARGAWWRFRPGRTPEAGGRRFPTPEWEGLLDGLGDVSAAGVVVEQIPAGLWVRWPGAARSTDLHMSIPMHAKTAMLLVSRAGDPPLRADDVAHVIQSLPEAIRDRLVVVPYGDNPVGERRLGAVVSLAANQTLRVRSGLPLHVPDGGSRVVAVGPNGVPTWAPFARELAWRPHGGARVLNWTTPSDQLLPVGTALLALNEHWVVEIVEAGLWIRETDRLDAAETVRQLPLESRRCIVVIGMHGAAQSRLPVRALVRLLRRLPDDARTRLIMALPERVDDQTTFAAIQAVRRIGEDVPVCWLTSEGNLVELSDDRGVVGKKAGRDGVAHVGPSTPKVERRPHGYGGDRGILSQRMERRGGDEAEQLLDFVDALRRMPAWDEFSEHRTDLEDARMSRMRPAQPGEADRGEADRGEADRGEADRGEADQIQNQDGTPAPVQRDPARMGGRGSWPAVAVPTHVVIGRPEDHEGQQDGARGATTQISRDQST